MDTVQTGATHVAVISYKDTSALSVYWNENDYQSYNK